MKNLNYEVAILLIFPLFLISCGKNTIGSRAAEVQAIMGSGTLGHTPEYTYSTYYDNPKYFTEMGEFWHASRNLEAWDTMNMIGINTILRYEKVDTLPFEGKRAIVENVSFELFKEFLVDDKNKYSKDSDKSSAILYYMKKLKEYDSNNNPGKFLKILDNIKPHIKKEDHENLVSYHRSTERIFQR